MSKKSYYWILGILIALIAVFVVWGLTQGSQTTPQSPSAEQPVTEKQTEIGTAGATDDTAAVTGYDGYIKDQDIIMSRMMQDMELTEDTGNAALDFISGMVPHHDAAIDMAESYLKHGGDEPQLQPLAQDIIKAQRDEITEMERLYQEISDSGKTNQEQADAYREAYQTMMEGHHAGHTMDTGSQASMDAAFAEGMIMHHQMAVDMATDILEYTDENAVRELAEQIIRTQEAEIKVMQDILDSH